MNYRVRVPTTWHFLSLFIHVAKPSTITKYRCAFIADRSLQEHDMLSFAPSKVAAAVLFVALRLDHSNAANSCWVRLFVFLPI